MPGYVVPLWHHKMRNSTALLFRAHTLQEQMDGFLRIHCQAIDSNPCGKICRTLDLWLTSYCFHWKKNQLVSPVHLQSHFIVCRVLHIPLCIFSFLLAETEAEYQVNVTGLVRLIIALRKESLEERVHPASVHECKLWHARRRPPGPHTPHTLASQTQTYAGMHTRACLCKLASKMAWRRARPKILSNAPRHPLSLKHTHPPPTSCPCLLRVHTG